jgi:hypothetical protein
MDLRKSPPVFALIVVFYFASLMSACSREVYVRYEFPPIYRSPAAVAAETNVVVIGQAVEKIDVINLNHGREDILVVGQVYDFQVDEYLKGSGEEIIYVVNREGHVERPGIGSSYTEEDILAAKENRETPVLRLGKRYILFLDYLSREGIDLENYYIAHEWRFNVTDPDYVIHNISHSYPYAHEMKYPRELDVLIQHIKDPVNHPYPDPGYRHSPLPDEHMVPIPVPETTPRSYPGPDEFYSLPEEVQSYPFPKP